MNKKHIISLCMALTLLCTVTACGTQAPASESQPAQNSTETSSSTSEAKEEKTINFDSETVFGDSISTDVFAENDLTLVNIFATWCGPCVEEIPYLQEIDSELDNVGVVGIVADTYDAETGERQEEAIETAKEIAEKTGAEYPFIIPDDVFVEDNFKNAAAMFPISYIVDQDGVVVSGPMGGAHTKEEWLDIINEALEAAQA